MPFIETPQRIYAENEKQFTAAEQLALEGFHYLKEQTETYDYTPDCSNLIRYAKELIKVFN